jgi:hypothetical protein
VKSTAPLKDIYWHPPLPATSPDGKQKGTLYHLKGKRRIVNPDLKREEVIQNYYFFVVDGDVRAMERNERGDESIKICKVVK